VKKNQIIPRKTHGFALIATILLMVLLAIITVGTLSLSVVTIRSSGQDSAQARARANARMALMIAIGELQKQVGPDQRITANGGILDNASTPANEVLHPHWTGAWNSWKAGDGTSFHRSVQGESLTGMSPTYLPGRNDFFRSWLLSLNPTEATDWDAPLNLTLQGEVLPSSEQDAILLVGEGSLGTTAQPNDYVSARLMNVYDSNSTSDLTGRYGWWVGDQNQKARVMADSYENGSTLTLAQKIARGQAPGSTGSKTILGLEAMTAAQEARLNKVASLKTLDLVIENNSQRPAQKNFHSVTPFSEALLTDVREGGLKRDLSALLERRIDPTEVDANPNQFSLYRFNTKDSWASSVGSVAPQETVPIQDLAAYYQLYDAVSPEAAVVDSLRTSNNRGVRYSPHSSLGGINGIHMLTMDYGLGTNSPVYQSAHSAIYRQPKIVKIQFLLSLYSRRINPAIPADMSNPTPNTHELLVGITPAITFWNPTNLPVVFQMNSNPALSAQMLRFNDLPIQIRYNKNNNQTITTYQSIQTLTGVNDGICSLYWAGIHPIRLEPGEVKTLSLPFSGDLANLKSTHGHSGHWNQGWAMSSFFMKTDTWYVGHEVRTGWEPESFIYCNNSAAAGTNNDPPGGIGTNDHHVVNNKLRFKAADRIQIQIGSGGNAGIGWMNNQSSYQDFCESPLTNGMTLTNWDRYNGLVGMRAAAGVGFYQPLVSRGMTGGQTTLTAPSRTGSSIIARSSGQAGWPFLHIGVLAGVETSETSNGGFAGGRKFPSRPFLHSSTLHSNQVLDNSNGNDLYNFGWNWTVDLLNDVYEAPVQVTATGSSYWGGGYTPESGTTHIIQQEIPVVPPISIAALSHARLGGWSLGDQPALPYPEMSLATATRRRTMNRAVGFGGLRPHTLQAIGNSYAHPQIPADQTYTTVSRMFHATDGSHNETFADHSYLANKAIWDEFFFSSITPQRTEVNVFESSDLEALDVAREFFFDNQPLPNRRMRANLANLDESTLTSLFSQKDDFTNGLADKIAAHLMVDGAFNINSTSVEAWKVFFSSLKGKPVAYIEKSTALTGADPVLATSHTGTPIGQVGLAGGAPFSGSPSNPSTANQWTSWRELTDTEIDQLSVAMVKQVKLRGPFLSLSEFVNRRLDLANPELSVKGALQAALDDPAVSINEAFRAADRKFSTSEIASMSPSFPLAAEGPVAYGSSAYIDQADVLRGFAEQFTPRGDTFVIRAYGDAIDANGKVAARAWCEATVQRLPEYVDETNAPETQPTNPAFTNANRLFGRKFQIVGFRWLNSSEI
jgi:type II secretory pathway pseudopilin PulG